MSNSSKNDKQIRQEMTVLAVAVVLPLFLHSSILFISINLIIPKENIETLIAALTFQKKTNTPPPLKLFFFQHSQFMEQVGKELGEIPNCHFILDENYNWQKSVNSVLDSIGRFYAFSSDASL